MNDYNDIWPSMLKSFKWTTLIFLAIFIISSLVFGIAFGFANSPEKNKRIAILTLGIIVNLVFVFLFITNNLNKTFIRLNYSAIENNIKLNKFYYFYHTVCLIALFFIIIGAFSLIYKGSFGNSFEKTWWISLCFCFWYLFYCLIQVYANKYFWKKTLK